MGMIEAVKTCLSNYANFNGRARRSELWWFTLAYFLVDFAIGLIFSGLGIVVAMIGGMIDSDGLAGFGGIISFLGTGLSIILGLALFIPSLAVCIRRLHDIGKSGWFYLMGLIPCVGGFILLYFFIQDSEPGPNMYGPNPKGIGGGYGGGPAPGNWQ